MNHPGQPAMMAQPTAYANMAMVSGFMWKVSQKGKSRAQ
jgi:hypothetical protein